MLRILTYNLGLARVSTMDFTPLKFLPPHLQRSIKDAATSADTMKEEDPIAARLLWPFSILDTPVASFAPYVNARITAAPDILSSVDADVICLQEIFDDKHRDLVIKGLEHRYPYVSINENPKKIGANDGLLTLSRFPIIGTSFTKFKCAPPLERMFSSKGFLSTRVDIGGTITDIINVHLTSGLFNHSPRDAEMIATRTEQIGVILKHIRQNTGGVRPIIAGDFNCGPDYAPESYNILTESGYRDMAGTAIETELFTEQPTFDLKNPLNAQQPTDEIDGRLDHVFTRASDDLSVKEVRIIGKESKVFTAHGRVPLSDHYGLLVHIG